MFPLLFHFLLKFCSFFSRALLLPELIKSIDFAQERNNKITYAWFYSLVFIWFDVTHCELWNRQPKEKNLNCKFLVRFSCIHFNPISYGCIKKFQSVLSIETTHVNQIILVDFLRMWRLWFFLNEICLFIQLCLFRIANSIKFVLFWIVT